MVPTPYVHGGGHVPVQSLVLAAVSASGKTYNLGIVMYRHVCRLVRYARLYLLIMSQAAVAKFSCKFLSHPLPVSKKYDKPTVLIANGRKLETQ